MPGQQEIGDPARLSRIAQRNLKQAFERLESFCLVIHLLLLLLVARLWVVSGPAGWKPDAAFRLLVGGSLDQVLNGLEYGFNLMALLVLPPFELVQAPSEILMGSQELPQPHEGAHNRDIHFDRTLTGQNGTEYGHALFSKGVGNVPPSTSAGRV